MTSDRPDFSLKRVPDKDKTVGLKTDSKTVKSGHEPQKGLDPKANGLTVSRNETLTVTSASIPRHMTDPPSCQRGRHVTTLTVRLTT
jgi:hypothetical protein